MRWGTQRLDEIAAVNPKLGMSPRSDDLVSFVPMAAVSERTLSIEGEEDRVFHEVANGYTQFRRGDIIVAKITPCFQNGKMAHAVNLKHDVGIGSTEFHVFRPGDKLDGAYLFHMLRAPIVKAKGVGRMKGAAGQRRVPEDYFAALQIPLPPLAEQKRIAGILDAADALRARRREALAQLDTLLQSTFLHMFGDPVTRPGVTQVPDGWSYATIADVATDRKYSCVGGPFGSDLTSKDYVDVPGVPVIRGGDLATDDAIIREDKFVFVSNEKAASLSRNMAFRGDVVISQRGARLAGQVALIPDDSAYERYVVSQSQMKVTLSPERMLPMYLIAYLRSQKGIQEMESRTISTGVPHINLGILQKFPVPVPPLEIQQQFTRVTDCVRVQRLRGGAHLTELDALFASLQSRAFNGEL